MPAGMASMQVPTGDADAKKLISDCIMLNMNYTPLAFTTPRKQKGQPSTISPTPSKESEEHETPCSGRAEHPKLQATPKRQARAQFAQFLDSQGDQQRWVVKKMGEKFGKEDAQKDLAQSQVAPVEQQEVAEEEEPQEEEEEEPQEEEEEEELPSLDELFAPDTPTGQTEIGDNTQVVGGYEENDAEDGQGQETGEIADKEDGNDQETGPKKIADENNGRDPATSVIVVDLESADEKYRLDCETQPGEIAGEKHHGGGQEIEPKETAYEKDGHDQCQETEPEESADKEDDRRDLMSKETEDSADDEHGKDCETQPMEMAGEKHGNDQEIEPESADDEHGKDCETQPMEMAGEKNAKDQEIEPESADEEHGQDCETQPMEIAGEKNGNEQEIEPKEAAYEKGNDQETEPKESADKNEGPDPELEESADEKHGKGETQPMEIAADEKPGNDQETKPAAGDNANTKKQKRKIPKHVVQKTPAKKPACKKQKRAAPGSDLNVPDVQSEAAKAYIAVLKSKANYISEDSQGAWTVGAL